MDSETISIHKKLFEVIEEKKRKREKINEKKKATTTKATQKFAELQRKRQVHELRDEILPPSQIDRRRSKQIGVEWSNIRQCLCNATIERKRKEKRETHEM